MHVEFVVVLMRCKTVVLFVVVQCVLILIVIIHQHIMTVMETVLQ